MRPRFLRGTQQQPLVVELATPKSSAFAVARAVIEPVLGPLETTVIVIIVAIFILMQREDLRDRFIRLFGSRDLHRTTIAMDDAGQRLSRYFVSQLCVNACFGVVIGVGLWLIGIPSAALWGVLAGLLRFVPYVGPLLAAVGPACACGGNRSRLVDHHLRGAVIRDRRTAHRVCGRAIPLRPLHWTVPHVGHCGCRLLDVDMGPGGTDPLHASDAVPRRAWGDMSNRSSSLTYCSATDLHCRK